MERKKTEIWGKEVREIGERDGEGERVEDRESVKCRMGGDHSPVRRGDGQEQKQTPKERGLLPGTEGLSRVMWVEIGQWGNVPGGGWVGIG